MKIDPSITPPVRLHSDPENRAALAGFAEILRQLGKSDSGNKDAAVSASSIMPQIGDSAIGFGEKPVVTLAALEFNRPEQLFDDNNGFFSRDISVLREQSDAEIASFLAEAVEPTLDRRSGLDRLTAQFSGTEMQALGNIRKQPLPPKQPNAPALPNASDLSLVRPQMPGRDNAQHLKPFAPAPDASSTTPNTERPAPKGAILANLLAVENGFRLVLRTPAMKAEEHADLIRRLAELFAEHGQVPPELLIYQSHTPDGGQKQ